MSSSTVSRLVWLLAPLLTVAVVSASEWPARTQMLEGPVRDIAYPASEVWASVVARATGSSPHSEPAAPVMVATAIAPAAALETPALPPSSPHPAAAPVAAPAVPTSGTVLMLGDSLMGGIVAGLRQNLPRQYTIIDRHKASTGLSNREYFDWPATAREATASASPQWVVIHLGGNDGQDIRENGQWLRFGSDAWAQAYQARAETMIQGIRASSPQAKIIWIGLPAMRPSKYEAKSVLIASLHRAAARSQGIDYIDGRTVLGNDYSKDGLGHDGRRHVWRLDDGIHYSRAGGSELGGAVMRLVGWTPSSP